jgi:starch phosphorylase
MTRDPARGEVCLQSIGRLTVFPSLPARVNRLAELAKNLYWTWTPTVQRLFEDINPGIYESVARNPMRTLLGVRQADLDRVAADLAYLERYDTALGEFDAYMRRDDLWYARTQPQELGSIAYFSMEFAFHESIQIYSGGLGVLAGDHCKSASDLGLPFAAVGLLFKEGYFHQQLTPEGWQEETYESLGDART